MAYKKTSSYKTPTKKRTSIGNSSRSSVKNKSAKMSSKRYNRQGK